MGLILDPNKAAMVLLTFAGWQNCVVGSLKLDTIELVPASPTADSEDYGFTFTSDTGQQVTGRLSALLAITEA